MLEYVFTASIIIVLIILYCIFNRPDMIGRIFGRFFMKNRRRELRRIYLDDFREYKQSASNRNIVIQLLPLVGVFALLFILGNQYLFFATVISGSMEPTFQKGDLVLMQTIDKKVEIGDIVVFRQYQVKEPISHRAVKITESGNIVTKGDANNFYDFEGGIPPDRIGAKAVVIGGKPIVVKALGFIIKPESIGGFQILAKMPAGIAFSRAFEQFRTISPLVLFFCVIFYFFVLLETRLDFNRRSNGKNGRKNAKNEPKNNS